MGMRKWVAGLASVIALDAQGQGNPTPPVAVGAALQGGHLLQGDGAPYSGGDGVPKRAFPLTSTERFPSASTVGVDLGKRRVAQRFPVFC